MATNDHGLRRTACLSGFVSDGPARGQTCRQSQIDWPEVHRVAAAFRLAMPRTPVGGRLGERLGSGTGSSLEFQDYRQYAMGDDLRHVDWSAYARSEVLTVRLYREEVAPRIDLVLDLSRSMTVTEEKAPGLWRTLRPACVCLCLRRGRLADCDGGGRSGATPRKTRTDRALPFL